MNPFNSLNLPAWVGLAPHDAGGQCAKQPLMKAAMPVAGVRAIAGLALSTCGRVGAVP
jgi:hypothetical protein